MNLTFIGKGKIYTEYAGLEKTAESAVAYGREKTEMLVPNCIGSYGSKAVSWPPCVIRISEQKIRVMTGKLGLKLNFFSLTVCRLDQYLTNGSENTVLLP